MAFERFTTSLILYHIVRHLKGNLNLAPRLNKSKVLIICQIRKSKVKIRANLKFRQERHHHKNSLYKSETLFLAILIFTRRV